MARLATQARTYMVEQYDGCDPVVVTAESFVAAAEIAMGQEPGSTQFARQTRYVRVPAGGVVVCRRWYDRDGRKRSGMVGVVECASDAAAEAMDRR